MTTRRLEIEYRDGQHTIRELKNSFDDDAVAVRLRCRAKRLHEEHLASAAGDGLLSIEYVESGNRSYSLNARFEAKDSGVEKDDGVVVGAAQSTEVKRLPITETSTHEPGAKISQVTKAPPRAIFATTRMSLDSQNAVDLVKSNTSEVSATKESPSSVKIPNVSSHVGGSALGAVVVPNQVQNLASKESPAAVKITDVSPRASGSALGTVAISKQVQTSASKESPFSVKITDVSPRAGGIALGAVAVPNEVQDSMSKGSPASVKIADVSQRASGSARGAIAVPDGVPSLGTPSAATPAPITVNKGIHKPSIKLRFVVAPGSNRDAKEARYPKEAGTNIEPSVRTGPASTIDLAQDDGGAVNKRKRQGADTVTRIGKRLKPGCPVLFLIRSKMQKSLPP